MLKAGIGIICVVLGVLYLIYVYRKRRLFDSDLWDFSMAIRGYIGGISLIILGISMILWW
jgi:hypothetical protein